MRLTCSLIVAGLVFCETGVGAAESLEPKILVQAVAEGNESQRAAAEAELRKQGLEAVPALRDLKLEGKEEGFARVRRLLADILAGASRLIEPDAKMVHDVAREEALGRRYANAKKLYQRAQELYDQLKDDAGRRQDRLKKEEYRNLMELCEKMRDKAERKERNEGRSGLNLGFVHIGPEHDMSYEWE